MAKAKQKQEEKVVKPYWEAYSEYAENWHKIITGKFSPRSFLFHPDLLSLEDCPVQESHWLSADRFQTKPKKDPISCVNEIIAMTPKLSDAKYNPKRPKHKTLFPQCQVYPKNLTTPPGGFYSLDEKLQSIYQRSADGYYQLPVDPKTIDRARALLKLGVLRKALLTMQSSTANETDMSDQLKKGKRIYEGIVKEFGKVKNWTMCRSDPRYYGIQSAFEDDKGKPTEFLSKRVRWRSKIPDFKSIVHAAQVSIGHCLHVDVDWIVKYSSWTKEKVEETLLQEEYIYPHWDGEQWKLVDMDDYILLNTNIREHDRLLDEMRDRFVESYGEEQLLRNKKVIQEAFPMPSSPPTSDVKIKRQAAIDAGFNFDEFDDTQKTECLSSGREIKLEINHFLIDTEYYEAYYLERFGTIAEVRRDTVFGLSKIVATFNAVPNHSPNGLPSTKKHTGIEVFTRLLKGQSAQYKEKGTTADGTEKEITNEEESAALAEAYKAWRKDFFDWLWSSEERALAIAKRFNTEINTTARIKLRGELMVDEHGGFPEITMPPGFKFHPYQLDGIYQFLRYRRLLIPLGCGAGKTLIALIACLIAKARGLANKPVFCVLKATKHAMVQEAKRIAPWARVFSLSESDSGARRHDALMALMHGEFDIAILTHDDLQLIPMGAEGVQLAYSAQLEALEEELKLAQNDRARFKTIGTQIQKLQDDMRKTLNRSSKISYCFEDFGFDMLIKDEFHVRFRRPGVRTSYKVKGIDADYSTIAMMTMLRFHYMMSKEYRIGAMTATPIVASLVEMFSLMRYFIPDILEDKGLDHADNWIETFCSITAENSFGSGGRMRVVEEVRDFNNIDLMLSLMRRFMLLVPISEQKRILKDRPEPIDVTIACPPTVGQCQFYEEIVRRVDAIMARKPKAIPTQKIVTNEEGEETIETVVVEDNHLVVYNHMRNAGLMAQVAYGSMGIDEPFSVNNKIFRCAQNVYKIKQILNKHGVTGHQLIFLDLSTKKKGMFSVYGVLEKVFEAMGIRVAIVHDLKHPQVELTQIALEQSADVIMVSTRKGATGVDHLQDHCIAMHHLDVPTMPAALTQREGRGVRIGNKFPKILQFYYVTQGANGNAGVDTLSLQACQTRMVPYLNLMGGINPGDSIADIGGEVMLLLEELKGIATGDSTYAELSALKNKIVMLEAAYNAEQLAIAKDISDRNLASTKIESNLAYLESVKPFEKKVDGLKAIVFHLDDFDLRVEQVGDNSYRNSIIKDNKEEITQQSTALLIAEVDKKVGHKTKGGDVLICKVMDFELYAITIVPEGKLITEIIGYYLSYPETGFRASVKLQVSDIRRTIVEHIPAAIKKAKNELSFYTKLQDSEPLVPTFDMEELNAAKQRVRQLTAEIKSLDNLKQKRVLNLEKAYDLGFTEAQVEQIQEALELSQNGQLRKAKAILDAALTIYGYDEEQACEIRVTIEVGSTDEQAVARENLDQLLTKKQRIRIEDITELVKDEEGEGTGLKLVPIASISCDPPMGLVRTLMEEEPVRGEDGLDWVTELETVLTEFARKPLLLEESEDD